jgi:hypothetical protein
MSLNLAELTKTPQPGRPLYKRATLVGGTILAVALYLESQGQLPKGSYAQFNESKDALLAAAQSIGGLLTLFGVYRQVSND